MKISLNSQQSTVNSQRYFQHSYLSLGRENPAPKLNYGVLGINLPQG
ncbi:MULTISPECIES: hypothetical protein [Calothrix]|uniref:Uncharacterized protein n=2 Tax=Calothrix TaxID=1186 RepID=A0ABR8AFD8_9CYAN|nr:MULTISPECIES: hypothetical protein [Calothrix]MBD2198661.1 hypothetical protein [Calothrix parietina FACHB-288]MBD2228670.1 hypothetical protein [Calothrix anomala FACHB-343]